MEKIKILHKPTDSEPFVILDKPAGLPSAPLSSTDKENAFFQAAEIFPDLLKINGKKEIEHGLIHRLDTATSGLVLIAASQEFYEYIIEQQKLGKVIKTYSAKCDVISDNSKLLGAYPETKIDISKNKVEVESYFRPYGPGRKEVRPVDDSCGKAALDKIGKLQKYNTEINIITNDGNKAEVLCRIENGYRHQVRSHLSWCGLPVQGDNLYNCSCKGLENCKLEFYAVGIEFVSVDGKEFKFSRN